MFLYVVRDNFPLPYGVVEESYVCFKNIAVLYFPIIARVQFV